VPPGFAISVSAYERFIKETGISDEIIRYLRHAFGGGLRSTELERLQEASRAIRNIVESREMPGYLKEDIAARFRTICDKCGTDAAFSVRSAGAKSHPGQYETYLNVVGFDHIAEKVIKVWSSIYNTKSIAAAIHQAIPVEECPPVGVCVLKMVNARAAGVCLTVHPITGDDGLAFIESSLGLGESVVSGTVAPDQFVVDKEEMKVKEVVRGKKGKKIVATKQGVEERQIPTDEQERLSITEEEAVAVIARAKKVESHFGVPQDIEWAIDDTLQYGENVVLLQTRNQVGIPEKKSETDKIVDMMIRKFRAGG